MIFISSGKWLISEQLQRMLNPKEPKNMPIAIPQQQGQGAALNNPQPNGYHHPSPLRPTQWERYREGVRHDGQENWVVEAIIKNWRIGLVIVLCCLVLVALGVTGRDDGGEFGAEGNDAILDATGKPVEIVAEPLSTEIKYKQIQKDKNYLKYLQESLKSHKYPIPKLLNQPPSPSATSVSNLPKVFLKTLAQKAVSSLINPMYPDYLSEILVHQPYQNLSFCLVAKLMSSELKEVNEKLVHSIFSLKYQNYMTIFLSDSAQTLTTAQLKTLQKKSSIQAGFLSRMYLRLLYPKPTYHDYLHMFKSLCPQNSFLMFVSAPLQPLSLGLLNNYHQHFPTYLTMSMTQEYVHVNSFAMRIFELVQINDFGGTNKKYLSQDGQEKFYAVAMMELCSRYSRQMPITEVSVVAPSAKAWMTGVMKTDSTLYSREKYQPIMRLGQTYPIDLEKQTQLLQQFKTLSTTAPTDSLTELQMLQLRKATEYQQLLFLPLQHALNKRQEVIINKTYGIAKKQERSMPIVVEEREICGIVVGDGVGMDGGQGYWRQRFMNNIDSILSQKYSNFHIVYINSGIPDELFALITQKVSQHKFPTNRFETLKNKQNKPLLFSIMKAIYQKCKQNQLVAIIHSDLEILGAQYLPMINYIMHYNKNIWVLNTNFKDEWYRFGHAHRMYSDYNYMEFGVRKKNLDFMAPALIADARLFRRIPLTHLTKADGKWFEVYWHKALTHAITELATVSHLEYEHEIPLACSDVFYDNFYGNKKAEEEYEYISRLPPLKPIRFINNRGVSDQKKVRDALNQL